VAISAEACSEVIRVFDSQGWHRTATEVDLQSGRWLVDTLSMMGVEARAVPFPFSRIDASECVVSAGDFRGAAVQTMDSSLPPPNTTIRGVFGPGSIDLVRVQSHGVAAELDGIRRSDCKAIVAAVAGYPGGTTLLNAWGYDKPDGVPVLQVPETAWEALVAAREAGAPVEVRCGGTRTATTGVNALAVVPGKRRSLPPVVVLTPRSGWWHCAGERGGGLAIWLEVARTADQLGLDRDLVFLATTGHELGFLGIKRYFDSDSDLARRAFAWIHLGANIGAAGAQLMIRASDQALLTVARELAPTFGAISPSPLFATTDRPVGEAGEVLVRGGRFISLVGANAPLFHSTLDRWPGAVDFGVVATAADGVLETIRALDRQV